MAFQNINIGVTANDGTGDPDRTAFDKINQNFSAIDNINKLFTSAASDLTGLAAELNTLNPPLVIGENEIYTFKLANGDSYQMLNKGKGTYGVDGVTNLTEKDFMLAKLSSHEPELPNGEGISAVDIFSAKENLQLVHDFSTASNTLTNIWKIVNHDTYQQLSIEEVLGKEEVSVIVEIDPISFIGDNDFLSIQEFITFYNGIGGAAGTLTGQTATIEVSLQSPFKINVFLQVFSNGGGYFVTKADGLKPGEVWEDLQFNTVSVEDVVNSINEQASLQNFDFNLSNKWQYSFDRQFYTYSPTIARRKISLLNKDLSFDLVGSNLPEPMLFQSLKGMEIPFDFVYSKNGLFNPLPVGLPSTQAHIDTEKRTIQINESNTVLIPGIVTPDAEINGFAVIFLMTVLNGNTNISAGLKGTIVAKTGEGDVIIEPAQFGQNFQKSVYLINKCLSNDNLSSVILTIEKGNESDNTSFDTVTGSKVVISDITTAHTSKLKLWFEFGHDEFSTFESTYVDTVTDIGRELLDNEISSYTKGNSAHMSISALVGKEIADDVQIDADVIHVTAHGSNSPVRIDWFSGDNIFKQNLVIVGAGLEIDLDANWQTSFGFGMEFIEATSISTNPEIPLGSTEPDVHQQSPATAIVAGKLRAIKMAVPSSTWQEVRFAARKTASRATNYDIYRGFGVINVVAAIAQLKTNVIFNALAKADVYNRNSKLSKQLTLSHIHDDSPLAKRHFASVGLVVADDIVNKAVEQVKEVGGFRDLHAPAGQAFFKTKNLKQAIKNLHEDELLADLTGVFLPELVHSSLGRMYNLLNPSHFFSLTRNTVKYGHRESGLIVQYSINEPAICHLYGKPELIVEPQRTNLVLNSEPIANEGPASAQVTYEQQSSPFGITNFVRIPWVSGSTILRWAGTVTDNNYYEISNFLRVLPGRTPHFTNQLSPSDDFYEYSLRGNTSINKIGKIRVTKFSEKFYKVSIIGFPDGSTTNSDNGFLVRSGQPTKSDIVASGISLTLSNQTTFPGSYIKTTGTTKTVDADVYTISNLLSNGLISSTEGTIIERGTFREKRTVWTGGNKLVFIDNALISTVAEVPSDVAFTLDTGNYRVSEILISNKAILP